MKKKIKFNKKNKIFIIIMFVFIFVISIFNYFNKYISDDIMYLARLKVEDLSNYYLNNVLKRYLNIDTSNYIKINFLDNNIITVDVDNNSSNKLLTGIINDLENNMSNIVDFDELDYYNMEIIDNGNGIILFIPSGVGLNNPIFATIGPRIPVIINFLENVDAYVDVEVENYGINNALIKLYINISLKVVIEMPIDKKVINMEYKFLLSSKLINGKVPDFLGTSLGGNSSIVNNSVN